MMKLVLNFFSDRKGNALTALVCLMLILPYPAQTAIGQRNSRITVRVENSTVLEALRQINRACGSQVLFKNEEVQKETARVTLELTDVSVEEAVARCLRGTALEYYVRADGIVVSPGQSTSSGTISQSPPHAGSFTGRIVDHAGSPLAGASVVIDGTAIGTATDRNGNFSLSHSSEQIKVNVSYIGYKPTSLTIRRGVPANIVLETDATAVSDVVVTGYQTVQRQRMTGTVTTITAEQIANRGYTTIEQALNASVAGLNLTASGRPGEDAQILIRGTNSLTGSTQPMWIVDGMPMQGELPDVSTSTDLRTSIFTTGIGNLAPDDIKSITVLKDAAATAIYGARAANGVIVIETKSGQEGKTRFSVSTNYGMTERPVNRIDMMNTAQKILFEQQYAYDEPGNLTRPGRVTSLMIDLLYNELSQEEVNAEIARLSGIDTNWFKEIYRPSFQQQHNISMSGGDMKTQYLTSLNFLDQKGVELNNRLNRATMNMRINHRPNEKLQITAGITGTIRNNRETASKIDPLQYAIFANPYERPYNDDGSYAYDMSWDPVSSTLYDGIEWPTLNALWEMKNNTKTEKYQDLQMQFRLEWEIIRGLLFTTQGVYNVNSNNSRTIEATHSYTNYKNNWMNSFYSELPRQYVLGSLREGSSNSNSYTWRNTLQYNREFLDKHYLSLFAGQEIYSRTAYSSSNYFPVFDEEHRVGGYPEMDEHDISSFKISNLGSTGKRIDKISSFFANFSYSYRDRYIFTGSIRYDGSDIIGNDNQFTPLWNVGARWNAERESFMKGATWINQLAVRLGFGYTGSIDKNALPFTIMNYGSYITYDNQMVPTSFSYPDYNVKWQTKQDFNVGLDLSLFDYKLNLSANYYYNITRDVLDEWRIATSSGRGAIKANVADLYNRGVELELGVTVFSNPDIDWTIRGNFAYNKNTVKNTFYKSINDLPTFSLVSRFVEDYPAQSWFGYKFAGIDPVTGYLLVWTGNEDAKYSMTNRSGSYEWADPQGYYFGTKIPPYTGGFGTSFRYKQLIFNTHFEFKSGHKILSYNTYKTIDSRNRHIVDLDRWRQPGDQTNIGLMSQTFYHYSSYLYDNRLENGNYLRCTYMNVGYDFKRRFLDRIGFNTARITFTANNLFMFTKYKGIDPSLDTSSTNLGYPNSRKYVLTLNFSF